MILKRYWGYARNDYSLTRCRQIDFAKKTRFEGGVLDLGSRAAFEKHLAHIDKSNILELAITDLKRDNHEVCTMDLSNTWHFPDNQFNYV